MLSLERPEISPCAVPKPILALDVGPSWAGGSDFAGTMISKFGEERGSYVGQVGAFVILTARPALDGFSAPVLR